MAGDIIDAGAHRLPGDHHAIGAHLAFAGAETAVHGALGADQKKHPVRILMDQIGNRAEIFLVQRVLHAYIVLHFRNGRDSLLPERVTLFADQPQIIGIDPHGINRGGAGNTFVTGSETCRDIFGPGNAVTENILPTLHGQIQYIPAKIMGNLEKIREFTTESTELTETTHWNNK